MKNPMTLIRNDFKALGQMIVDYGTFLPEPAMQVEMERKLRRLLKKYNLKKSQSPKFKATTK